MGLTFSRVWERMVRQSKVFGSDNAEGRVNKRRNAAG